MSGRDRQPGPSDPLTITFTMNEDIMFDRLELGRLCSTLVLGALLGLPTGLSGQASAAVNANATVLAQLNAGGTADLEFGDLIPGFSRTVEPSDPDAGRFVVSGAGNLEVSLSFSTLPSHLLHADGVAQLPISFGSGAAGFGPGSSSVTGTFDPSAGQATSLVDQELHVFIGGTVNPAAGQLTGNYSGVITLDVAYTGN